MKFNPKVSSSRRTQRKAHFQAPSSKRRLLMSAPLSAELKTKHNVRSMPIRRGDEVKVARGSFAGREGKVTSVYRKKYVIHVEKIDKEKVTGDHKPIGLSASNVVITKLNMDKDRQNLLDRKASTRDAAAKK